MAHTMAQESARNRCYMAAKDASHKTSIKWPLDADRFVFPSLQYMCERVQKLMTKCAFWEKLIFWYWEIDIEKNWYSMAARPTLNFHSFRRNKGSMSESRVYTVFFYLKFLNLVYWFLIVQLIVMPVTREGPKVTGIGLRRGERVGKLIVRPGVC